MYGQTEAADPYAFRIEPVYRKLRYEIGCAMQGLRGTDDWRKGDPVIPGGLYKQWPKAEDGTPLTPVTPAIQADKDYLERAGKALKALADKLKAKPEELNTEDFTLEKLTATGSPGKDPAPLAMMTKVVDEVIVKAKPKAADPLKEPDPADEAPVPVKPAKPKPVTEPEESEPAPVEAAAPVPAKPVKAKAPDPAE